MEGTDRRVERRAVRPGWTTGAKCASNWKRGHLHGSQLSCEFIIQEKSLNSADQEKLGAFRWSGGLSLQSDSTANASLLDQRFALEWVQQNIKSFGGDPKEVTL